MARLYRSSTVEAIYQAVAASPAVAAGFPQRRLLRDDRTGRAKRLIFRSAGDFPCLQVRIGTADGGQLFVIRNFADEAGGGPAEVERSAEIVLEFVYDQEDEATQDELETAALAAVALAGKSLDEALTALSYRRHRGPADIDGKRRYASRITLTASFLLDRTDIV